MELNFLDRLEKRLGTFAIPHLTFVLVMGQLCIFVFGHVDARILDLLNFDPVLFQSGEVWRIVTFLFIPPSMHPISAFFGLYLFYLMGGALEAEWGYFRYNIYIFTGSLATVISAFLAQDAVVTNAYIGGSVFLAFAYLYPNFEILLFFILPIKVRYLAMFTWIIYGFSFVTGDWMTRFLVFASVSNFFLFFGKHILGRMRQSGMSSISRTRCSPSTSANPARKRNGQTRKKISGSARNAPAERSTVRSIFLITNT